VTPKRRAEIEAVAHQMSAVLVAQAREPILDHPRTEEEYLATFETLFLDLVEAARREPGLMCSIRALLGGALDGAQRKTRKIDPKAYLARFDAATARGSA